MRRVRVNPDSGEALSRRFYREPEKSSTTWPFTCGSTVMGLNAIADVSPWLRDAASASAETSWRLRGTEAKRPGGLTLIPMDREDAEGFLRSPTAEALRVALPGDRLLPVSLSLQAVANAFVMLGLPETRAEEILAAPRSALEAKGFEKVWGVTRGELTVRPGAHGYWDSRATAREGWLKSRCRWRLTRCTARPLSRTCISAG